MIVIVTVMMVGHLEFVDVLHLVFCEPLSRSVAADTHIFDVAPTVVVAVVDIDGSVFWHDQDRVVGCTWARAQMEIAFCVNVASHCGRRGCQKSCGEEEGFHLKVLSVCCCGQD